VIKLPLVLLYFAQKLMDFRQRRTALLPAQGMRRNRQQQDETSTPEHSSSPH
jgi:hypothetical protein